MTEKRYRLLLFAIFLLAVLTRFFGIASDSLWLDEGLSIRLASLPFWEVFREAAPVDHNPPLYLYLLHFWIKLFGNSEAATRSLAALLNLATFPVIVAILQRLTSREATLLALLIFVLSPFQIYYAQETRAYSLLNFLSATSLLCFLQLLKSPKPAMQILYVFSSALLLYSHIYGAFILLFENLWWVYLQIAGKDSPPSPAGCYGKESSHSFFRLICCICCRWCCASRVVTGSTHCNLSTLLRRLFNSADRFLWGLL